MSTGKGIRSFAAVALAAALAFAAVGARADMSQEQIQELLNELKGIRAALEKMQPPAQTPQEPVSDKVSMLMPTSGYALGKADAPLVVVEYTDLQCPFCQQFHNTAFDQLKKDYIDTGKVRFMTRDFPLDFHPNAKPAAIASRCAGDQGKFWEMRHVMHVNADKLSKDEVLKYAADLKLDTAKFKACADSDFYSADIDRQFQEGSAVGITGTPSFVVGRVVDGKLDGVRLVGALPFSAFDAKLKELLETPPAK
jgi:protein-disulfide isomerase